MKKPLLAWSTTLRATSFGAGPPPTSNQHSTELASSCPERCREPTFTKDKVERGRSVRRGSSPHNASFIAPFPILSRRRLQQLLQWEQQSLLPSTQARGHAHTAAGNEKIREVGFLNLQKLLAMNATSRDSKPETKAFRRAKIEMFITEASGSAEGERIITQWTRRGECLQVECATKAEKALQDALVESQNDDCACHDFDNNGWCWG